MRFVALILCFLPTAALSQGFYGGAADGMREAEERQMQRRALDLDARDGGSRYNRLQNQIQQERIQRQLEENNRLLRDMERNRILYGR